MGIRRGEEKKGWQTDRRDRRDTRYIPIIKISKRLDSHLQACNKRRRLGCVNSSPTGNQRKSGGDSSNLISH